MNILYKNSKAIIPEGIIIPCFKDSVKNTYSINNLSIDIPTERLKNKKLFEGKKLETYTNCFIQNNEYVEVMLVGLGEKEKLTQRNYKKAIGKAYRQLKSKKVSSIGVYLNGIVNAVSCNYTIAKNTVQAILIADYNFDDYKTEKKEDKLKEVTLILDNINEDFINGFDEGIIVGNNITVSRELTNQPANVLTPTELSNRVIKLGEKSGFDVEIYDYDKIKELKMEAYLSVARASSEPPKFIIMRYHGNPGGETLGFVGKGLTYDAGGLSIKPTKGMSTMKCDMGGAGDVIGAMCAVAQSKLKVNLIAVVAACENMLGGNSYKPGDIIGSMGGKTIYIGNTDAEGRLTLIDAVHYIINHEKVDKVVDIATLTGSVVAALGTVCTLSVSNNDEFSDKMNKSFDESGEYVCRMPVFEEYYELLKHPEADLTNIPDRPGSITAGLFIEKFVGDIPWIHLDIAGTSYLSKKKDYMSSGAAGVGVAPLYHLAKNMAN
ncbi:leucyl aminopeptidase [Clostridiaceae bacterium M8S5]|nr:leucyl aminopeptidase [Clostridiaceae bacterium M8S5]